MAVTVDIMNTQQQNYQGSQRSELELLKLQVADLADKIRRYDKAPRIVLVEDMQTAVCERQLFMHSPDEVFKHCRDMGGYTREVFRVIFLNVKNLVIADEIIAIGTGSGCSVEINEIFRLAVRHGAVKIITVHNHPSGDPTPSEEDCRLTTKIRKTGRLFKVVLADNIIIGRNCFASI